MLSRRTLLICLLFVLFALHPVSAYAYLPVVIGLVGLAGGVGAALITAALVGAYLVYRILRSKNDEDEEDDDAEAEADKDNKPSL